MPAIPERLQFDEAIDFIGGKARLPSVGWTDLKESAHARAFVVAGATKDALVADFHQAVTRAVAEGRTKADFLRDFDAIVARNGWSYKGGRGWRSGVIYTTNMRMSYQAGKWAKVRALAEQLAKQGRVVYLRYSAILDGGTRPLHREWGTAGGRGIILPWDHPWWDKHYPPNDWGCRCTVEILTDDDLADMGLDPTPEGELPSRMEDREVETRFGAEIWPTPEGVGTGFGYNVGKAWLQGAVPPQLHQPMPAPGGDRQGHGLPPLSPHRFDASRLLPKGLSDGDYVSRFLAEFGAAPGRPAAFRDVSGTLLAVGQELFIDRRTGGWKVQKNDREVYLLALADALKEPDEIWADWFPAGNGAFVVRRRYLRTIDLPDGAGALASFQWPPLGWEGRTIFQPDADGYLEGQRRGVLLWKRPAGA
ncbi:MAG TPA: PBECR2 nuclease fold domain-containing protein [Candidatus Omnitrophota bacterium]|nr:PBECR2 nuclease fold domain-containing protein [Candidatus Omnitrophota bacterium]